MTVTVRRNSGLRPPRIVLYGVRGIGKTTFAAQARDPIFLRTEDGLGALDVDTFDTATSLQDVEDQIRWLVEAEHNHRTLVIDSLSALEPLVWAAVCDKYRDQKGNRVTSIEAYPYKAGYLYAAEEWLRLLRLLDAVRDRGMTQILIGHARTQKHEPPDMDPYEKWGPSLHKEAAGRVMDWADAVLFVRYQMGVTDARRDGRSRGKPVGSGERIMLTTERPPWSAKNRYSLPDEMPFSWAGFAAAVAACAKRQTQTSEPKTAEPQPQPATTNET